MGRLRINKIVSALLKGKILALLFFCILVFKLGLGVIASHPFDFASYIYQSKQSLVYEIDPLYYWNKGTPLIAFFYIVTILGAAIHNILNIVSENPLIFKFITSSAYLIFDIATGLMLVKLSGLNDSKKEKLLFITWLINPIILWFTYVHSQYSIIVIFLLVLSYLLITRRRYFLAGGAIGVASSIYYFPILLMPIIMLYIYRQKTSLYNAMKFASMAAFSFLLSIGPLLIDPINRTFFINSLTQHNTAESISGLNGAYPNLSLLNYIETSSHSAAVGSILRVYSESSIFLGAIACIIVYLALYNYTKTRRFNDPLLLKTSLLLVTIFILTLGKIQLHYVTWIVPFLSLLAVKGSRKFQILVVALYSATAFYAIAANNISIYLLDSTKWKTIDFQLYGGDENILTLLGFFIALTLVLMTLYLVFNRINTNSDKSTDIRLLRLLPNMILFPFFCLLLIGGTLYHEHKGFSSAKNILSYRSSTYNIDRELVSNSQYSLTLPPMQQGEKITITGTGNLNTDNYSWYAYTYGGTLQASASIGSEAMELVTRERGVTQEVSLGGDNSENLIPIELYDILNVEIEYTSTPISPIDSFTSSVRFLDSQKQIISGSDIQIDSEEEGILRLKGAVPHPRAKYAEIVFKLRGSEIVNSVTITRIEAYKSLTVYSNRLVFNDHVNISNISSNIISNPETSEHFILRIRVLKNNVISRLEELDFNGCQPLKTIEIASELNYYYPLSCYKIADNKMRFETVNTDFKKIDLIIEQKETGQVPEIL